MTPPPVFLAFARGVSPAKWERRWNTAFPDVPVALVPLPLASSAVEGEPALGTHQDPDLSLLRYAPGTRPQRDTVHGVRLYDEAVALVVPTDHEFAGGPAVTAEDLVYVPLISHPDHVRAWPDPVASAEAHTAQTVKQAVELVAAGVGAVLAPLPLARHLSRRDVAVVEVQGLEPTSIWAVWDIERDDAVIQNLIGILRGRTPTSSRSSRGPTARTPQPRRARKRR